jgi:hypothetical protein
MPVPLRLRLQVTVVLDSDPAGNMWGQMHVTHHHDDTSSGDKVGPLS